MPYCKHVMVGCNEIADRGTKSAWFAKCDGCKSRQIYSKKMYQCIECRVFIHKKCWEFGHRCVIESINDEQSVTIAAGLEVSETTELPPQERMPVEIRDITTQTKADSVEGSTQTDLLDQCDASMQTDMLELQCHRSTQTDLLSTCSKSAQTDMLVQSHQSAQTDAFDQCHASVQTDALNTNQESSTQTDTLSTCSKSAQTDMLVVQCHTSAQNDEFDQCHASAQTDALNTNQDLTTQTDMLAQCHESDPTDVFDQCHASVQSDLLNTCHTSVQTDMLAQCHESDPTDFLYPFHATTTYTGTTDLAGDDYSSLADRSEVPPGDFFMCEKLVIRPGMAFFSRLVVLPSYPAAGSGDAGEADVGPGVPNAECGASNPWSELCARDMCLTPKQQKRKIQVEKNAALKLHIDAISALQELCAVRGWNLPKYCRRFDMPHTYLVECTVMGCMVNGEGESNKDAKRQAAFNAYMAITSQDNANLPESRDAERQ